VGVGVDVGTGVEVLVGVKVGVGVGVDPIPLQPNKANPTSMKKPIRNKPCFLSNVILLELETRSVDRNLFLLDCQIQRFGSGFGNPPRAFTEESLSVSYLYLYFSTARPSTRP